MATLPVADYSNLSSRWIVNSQWLKETIFLSKVEYKLKAALCRTYLTVDY